MRTLPTVQYAVNLKRVLCVLQWRIEQLDLPVQAAQRSHTQKWRTRASVVAFLWTSSRRKSARRSHHRVGYFYAALGKATGAKVARRLPRRPPWRVHSGKKFFAFLWCVRTGLTILCMMNRRGLWTRTSWRTPRSAR